MPNKTLQSLCVALGLLGLPMSGAFGADVVTIHRSIEYYDVSGTTLDEIRLAMSEGQPPEARGFISVTNFYFEYAFNWVPTQDASGAASCTITNASVIIDVVVKLPRHTALDTMPADVRAIWDRFDSATNRHEMRHVEDIVEIGMTMPAALNAVTAPTCDEVASQGEAVARDIRAQAQQRADAYDAETNHGINDGATLE